MDADPMIRGVDIFLFFLLYYLSPMTEHTCEAGRNRLKKEKPKKVKISYFVENLKENLQDQSMIWRRGVTSL